MARSRVPGYITTQASRQFGLEVQVDRSLKPKVNELPSGDIPPITPSPVFKGYREVIPPGNIGTNETTDPNMPPAQYVDTVASYPGEQNDTRLHGAMASLRAADTQSIPFQDYPSFTPRTAPMPRAVQDELYLKGYGKNVADPRMTDDDSGTMLIPKDAPDRCDLFGANRAGVLHNPTGGRPAPPMATAPPQAKSRQVGRGNLRQPHMDRPPELADQPITTKKTPIP